MKAIHCKCGCGEEVKCGNIYIVGHNRKGKSHTNQSKKKMSIAHIGKCRIFTAEHISNLSKKRKAFTEKAKRNMRLGQLGGKKSKKTKQRMSIAGKNKIFTLDHKKNISKSKRGKLNNNWLGGISFEPYGLEFNNELKAVIRKRDNNCCRLCGIRQYKLKHPVHHIDYNKQNNNYDNLITLCKSCHGKINKNRKQYRLLFQKMIKIGIGVIQVRRQS